MAGKPYLPLKRVLSGRNCFTSVFGMGTGVSNCGKSPAKLI